MNNTIANNTATLLNTLIKERRTVKPEKYDTSKKVDDNIVLQILENAHWAPNHGLNEPWHFVVFSGNSKKSLSDFLSKSYQELSGSKYNESKHKKVINRPFWASHIIAICMKRREKTKIPIVEDIEAVACAVQNMHLTAQAYGVAGYWNSGVPTYEPVTKEFLGLSEADKCLGFFYIGYPQNGFPIGKRKVDFKEKVEWR